MILPLGVTRQRRLTSLFDQGEQKTNFQQKSFTLIWWVCPIRIVSNLSFYGSLNLSLEP